MESPFDAYYLPQREGNRLKIIHLRYLTFMLRRASFRIFLSVMIVVSNAFHDELAESKLRSQLSRMNDGEDEIVFPPPPPTTTPETRYLLYELTMAEVILCSEYVRFLHDSSTMQSILDAFQNEATYFEISDIAKLLYNPLLMMVKDGTLYAGPAGNDRRNATDNLDEFFAKVESIIEISYRFPEDVNGLVNTFNSMIQIMNEDP